LSVTLADLATIVSTARFDMLVGEMESQFLDAKGQPYRFDEGTDGKRAFAKDVASFANAQGGYILIGFATKISDVNAGEQIAEVRPIRSQYFNTEQHRKILQEWLYPQPLGIEINWIPFGNEPEKGVLALYIPPQNDRSKPFLITKTVTDKKSTDVIIAYVERRLDFTEPHSIVEIHQALRNGFNLERELLGRIENIELLITQHFSTGQETESAAQLSSQLRERISRLINEAKG